MKMKWKSRFGPISLTVYFPWITRRSNAGYYHWRDVYDSRVLISIIFQLYLFILECIFELSLN